MNFAYCTNFENLSFQNLKTQDEIRRFIVILRRIFSMPPLSLLPIEKISARERKAIIISGLIQINKSISLLPLRSLFQILVISDFIVEIRLLIMMQRHRFPISNLDSHQLICHTKLRKIKPWEFTTQCVGFRLCSNVVGQLLNRITINTKDLLHLLRRH